MEDQASNSYLVPMLFDTAFCPVGERLPHISMDVLCCILSHATFAISPQLLPSSRILFNVCSSCAVHGVFVLGFFLLSPSREASEIGAPLLDGPRGDAGGGIVFKGLLIGSGLAGDRGRLRGFDGGGGRRSTPVLESCGGGACDEELSVAGLGEFTVGDDFCRL